MPNYIVKPSPDEDFYVLWSEVTESPHAWGPRNWLLNFYPNDRDFDFNRFVRADQNGSSAVSREDNPLSEVHGYYWWDDDTFVYDQRGICPRANLKALCERLTREEDVTDLLVPFDGEGRGEARVREPLSKPTALSKVIVRIEPLDGTPGMEITLPRASLRTRMETEYERPPVGGVHGPHRVTELGVEIEAVPDEDLGITFQIGMLP